MRVVCVIVEFVHRTHTSQANVEHDEMVGTEATAADDGDGDDATTTTDNASAAATVTAANEAKAASEVCACIVN